MNKGDIVISTNKDYPLHCATQIYSHAICISVEPLVLVSDSGDMRWSCLNPDHLKPVGKASDDVMAVAMRRELS